MREKPSDFPLDPTNRPDRRHSARAAMKIGAFEAHAEVRITSGGLLSVAVLASSILLSVAPIISAAKRAAAAHRDDPGPTIKP